MKTLEAAKAAENFTRFLSKVLLHQESFKIVKGGVRLRANLVSRNFHESGVLRLSPLRQRSEVARSPRTIWTIAVQRLGKTGICGIGSVGILEFCNRLSASLPRKRY
jgi:hypothetical protein